MLSCDIHGRRFCFILQSLCLKFKTKVRSFRCTLDICFAVHFSFVQVLKKITHVAYQGWTRLNFLGPDPTNTKSDPTHVLELMSDP